MVVTEEMQLLSEALLGLAPASRLRVTPDLKEAKIVLETAPDVPNKNAIVIRPAFTRFMVRDFSAERALQNAGFKTEQTTDSGLRLKVFALDAAKVSKEHDLFMSLVAAACDESRDRQEPQSSRVRIAE